MMILQEVDIDILLWIQEHLRVDVLTPLWKVITFLGNGGWFWIVASVLLICFGKTRKAGITAVLSLALGFLITNLLLKNIVARPRPFDSYAQILPLITKPTDYSFPSGHTCASFACSIGLSADDAREIWSSVSDPCRNGCFFQTLSGSSLSGRCTGRFSGSSVYKYNSLFSGKKV